MKNSIEHPNKGSGSQEGPIWRNPKMAEFMKKIAPMEDAVVRETKEETVDQDEANRLAAKVLADMEAAEKEKGGQSTIH